MSCTFNPVPNKGGKEVKKWVKRQDPVDMGKRLSWNGAEKFTTTTTKGIKLHEKDDPGPTVGGAGRGLGPQDGG